MIVINLHELFLKENVGGFDLLARSAIGAISVFALALDLVPAGNTTIVVAAIGAIALYTALTRHCLPYALLGKSTAKK